MFEKDMINVVALLLLLWRGFGFGALRRGLSGSRPSDRHFALGLGDVLATRLIRVMDGLGFRGELVGTEASHHSGNASHDVSVRVNFSVAPPHFVHF